MLGAVLEVATGKTLDQMLDERIFESLGIDETSFYLSSDKSERSLAAMSLAPMDVPGIITIPIY